MIKFLSWRLVFDSPPCAAGSKMSQPTGPACTLVCTPARLNLMQPAVTSNEGSFNNKAASVPRLVEIKVGNMTRHMSLCCCCCFCPRLNTFFFSSQYRSEPKGVWKSSLFGIRARLFNIHKLAPLRCAACLRNTVHFSLRSAGHCLPDTHACTHFLTWTLLSFSSGS